MDLLDAVIAQVPAGRAILSDGGQGAAPSARPQGVEAPYLQLVMQPLWREEQEKRSARMRLATLTELKGAEAIVRGHLDAALAGIGEEDREVCARMFQFLVTASGAKIAHTAPDLASFLRSRCGGCSHCWSSLRGRCGSWRRWRRPATGPT